VEHVKTKVKQRARNNSSSNLSGNFKVDSFNKRVRGKQKNAIGVRGDSG